MMLALSASAPSRVKKLLLLLPLCPPQRSRSAACRQPVMAVTAAEAGGGRAGGGRPVREEVTFLVPGQGPLTLSHLTQSHLVRFLDLVGAIGFKHGAAHDRVSVRLEDLPVGEVVELQLATEPPFADRVKNIEASFKNLSRAEEEEMAACMRLIAEADNPGVSIIPLQTSPFLRADGLDYAQFDAIFVAGSTAYIGEFKRVLGEGSIDDLFLKFKKIRKARELGTSPDLAAALQGVTAVKLFLGGKTVRAGLPVEEMVSLAAEEDMSVLLLSGQALGLAGPAAGAVPLPL